MAVCTNQQLTTVIVDIIEINNFVLFFKFNLKKLGNK